MRPRVQAPRLLARYREAIVPALMESLGVENPHQVPRLQKVVINIGVSDAKENIQALETAKEELALITGQAPQVRRAKKAISNFKLRQGMPIGLRATLRGARMYEFMDRFISVAIPRLRDFRGLDPGGFDGGGNYNLGLKEQMIFPEVKTEKVTKMRGMNISFVTDAARVRGRGEADKAARQLLEAMGMPFRRRDKAPAGGGPAGTPGGEPAPSLAAS